MRMIGGLSSQTNLQISKLRRDPKFFEHCYDVKKLLKSNLIDKNFKTNTIDYANKSIST